MHSYSAMVGDIVKDGDRYVSAHINLDGLAVDHLRLLIKVARLYHEQNMVQPEIARRLHISQPRVSRLLREAVSRGIVRTTVVTPPGLHAGLEDDIARTFDLADVVVTDTAGVGDEASLMRALGAAAADYLEPTLTGGDSIGISSWSATLSAMVAAMRPKASLRASHIVQILGGVGHATAQAQATRTTAGLAQLTGATPIYLPAPGLVPDPQTRDVYRNDPQFKAALTACEELTVVLLGIGSLEPSPLLQESGNALPPEDQAKLRALGAVGDVSMHFFDDLGAPVTSDLDERILGISADTMRAIPRRVGVAGGVRKYTAIRAALRGRWINVLITDLDSAKRLAAEPAGT
jgi:DNA-binding transcriptional regulator LsrR (DeoR family)